MNISHGRKIRKIQDSANWIVASVCIYNFLKRHGDELPDGEEVPVYDLIEDDSQEEGETNVAGAEKRNYIMNLF